MEAEVDWDSEIGGRREGIRRRSGTLLFENIQDYRNSHGRRLLINTHYVLPTMQKEATEDMDALVRG